MEFVVDVGLDRQIELPEQVVRHLGLVSGDRIRFVIDEAELERVQLRRVRRSYAGILDGLFGSAEEVLEYIREERASWAEFDARIDGAGIDKE